MTFFQRSSFIRFLPRSAPDKAIQFEKTWLDQPGFTSEKISEHRRDSEKFGQRATRPNI